MAHKHAICEESCHSLRAQQDTSLIMKFSECPARRPGWRSSQITSASLSKLYHPDTTKETNAKDKFHRIREAYSVLGDDRQRRAYDRTLPSSPSSSPGSASHSYGTHHMHHWSHDATYETGRRGPGATHAWEHPRARRTTSEQQQQQNHSQTHSPFVNSRPGPSYRQHEAQQRQRDSRTDPFASPNVRRATKLTRKEAQAEQERRAHDRITRESSIVRFLQVLGVVLFVGSLGGWTAHAK